MMFEFMLNTFSGLPISGNQLRVDMKDYIDEQLAWCEDESFSSQFPYQETGLPQRFFQQKVVACYGDEYLTGPRYLGGDIRKPFIELVASSAPITKRAASRILDTWRPMGASSIRLLRRPVSESRGQIDLFVYANPTPEKAASSEHKADGIRLQRADMSMKNWCVQAICRSYEYTYLKIPGLKENIYPADEEEIVESIKAANAFIIYSGSSPAGVIICKQKRQNFISGHWITEEIILPEFRGKHLASSAQRLLYSSFQAHSPKTTLWGTIANDNIPSIRTAELAGRERVMEYVFLNQDDIDV